MKHIPGVDMSSGSLGQGSSAAVGMALAGKLDNASYRVYCVLGDGEVQEGQVWEAAMFAGARKLDNLVFVVDNNGLQIDGAIEDVCSPYPLPETKGMPTAIIAKSVKGKGVSFMENQASWHGSAPNDEQYAQAMEELEKAGAAL